MQKFLVLIVGISIMALGTSICSTTGLGIDPFNAFCVALSKMFNIQLGTMILLLQAILGTLVFIFDKRKLGFGTLIPMISFGYFLQFFNWLVPKIISFDFNMPVMFVLFILGMIIISFGMSMYMECAIGMVPYDSFAFILGERMGKRPFVFRITIDTAMAILAFTLGGPINIGTILLAIGVGPLIDYFRKNVVGVLLFKS